MIQGKALGLELPSNKNINNFNKKIVSNQYFHKPPKRTDALSGSEIIDGKFQYILKKDIKSIDDIENIDDFFEGLELPVWINFNSVRICTKIFNKLMSYESNTYRFSECYITKDIEFVDLNDFDVSFIKCDFESESLSVKGCKKSILTIKESVGLINITSENCLKFVYDLQSIAINEISFKNNTRVNINLSDLINPLLLNLEINEIDVLIIDSIIIEKFYMDLTYVDKFNIKFCKFQKLSLSASFYKFFNEERCDINELIIWGNKFDKLFIGGSENIHIRIDYLELNFTNNIDVYNADIRKIKIQGKDYTNVMFENLKMSILNFENFVNSGKFKFRLTNINPKDSTSHFSLSNSVLSGIEFDGSFLHLFKSITLEDSTLSGVLLHYFKPIKNKVIRNAKASTSAKIELCRELTSLMQAQNNSHYATTYRALEQNFRLKERFRQFKIFNSDTLILTLNKITNNHGTQPFLAFIGMIVLVFCYYLILNREFSLNPTSLDTLNIMTSNVSYFFKPFTFISEIKEIDHEFSFGFRLWDILYKILYAYLVYQFIAAFRKFNK